ncbi:hypothetical protein lerEdw1_008453 [Lerista edwardsae]|nr:hypothetical protein lerEdw1_008453 [Lerista edwardsae]
MAASRAADAPVTGGLLSACLESLSAATAQPERFLSVQDGLAADFSSLTKTLYDFHKALEADVLSGSPLKELVIENFDEEQIWQQLELQNSTVLRYFKKAVSRNVEVVEDFCLLPDAEEDVSAAEDSEKQTDPEDQMEEEPGFDSDNSEKENESEEIGSRLKAKKGHAFSDDESDMDFDIDKLEKQTQKSKATMKKTGEKSIVDDRFFKLAEMEAILDSVEKKENRDKEEDEDEGIDYFEDVLSEDDDEDDEEFGEATIKPIKSARDFTYQDYFDPVDDDDDNDERFMEEENRRDDQDEEEGNEPDDLSYPILSDDDDGIVDEMVETDEEPTKENEKRNELSKKVTFTLPHDSETEDDDAEVFQDKTIVSPEIKSSFEKRQEKMNEKIKSLEAQLLQEKSWQLRGEVTGQKRPENSLLEEMLLFDHAVRMAPVITEETTLELEEIIKRRIKDQAWDDVVRKEKPKDDPYEYKKRLTLDHEKSKLSLAEIYEQEYLKHNQKKTEEEEKPEHAEIQKMMDSLFLKLDALSNFHFTPKPPVPEVKIVSNLPAITMEEVAPVSVSDAALLAPEEIKEKNKGADVKTDAEKTSTDKKRERRKKKLRKRIRLREREKRQRLLEKNPKQSTKLSKKASAEQLKKITKGGRASLLKDDGKDKALKSSQAFFSQLQDQVKMQIKDAKESQRKPKKRELSAQKLKL